MRRSAAGFLTIFLLLASIAVASAALHVSPDGRRLVDQSGEPFLMVGDTAWSLMVQLTLPEADIYLQNRRDKGFNLVLVNLIEHQFASNAPENAYGVPPFSGAAFATPNESYFAHADQVIATAAQYGIVVLLAPVYLGFGCGSEGWCAEVQAASAADMRQWGRFLGARYRSFDNIVWLIGGDTDPSPVQDKLGEVVAGIHEFDTVHLITTHNQPGSMAVTEWPGEGWLKLNNVYTYDSTLYVDTQDAYQTTPTVPFFLVESAYENERNSTWQELRAQSYWTVLSGGIGHIFGNCPIWHFGYSAGWCGLTDWQTQLDNNGSVNMMYFQRLFRSRHWDRLVPDLGHTVMTAGYGTWGQPNYATTATASDGTSIIAYLPDRRPVTVNSTALSGSSVRAWWYDPGEGTATSVGVFPEGPRTYSPPVDGDWVLVLDDAALDWPAPGEPLGTVAAPAADTSTMLGLEPNDPNPFAGSTTLRYALGRDTHVRIAIYNLAGARVRTLVSAEQSAGKHSVTWDGRTDRGTRASAGVYFCRLQTAYGERSRKLVLAE
jgi:hypothetical protein